MIVLPSIICNLFLILESMVQNFVYGTYGVCWYDQQLRKDNNPAPDTSLLASS